MSAPSFKTLWLLTLSTAGTLNRVTYSKLNLTPSLSGLMDNLWRWGDPVYQDALIDNASHSIDYASAFELFSFPRQRWNHLTTACPHTTLRKVPKSKTQNLLATLNRVWTIPVLPNLVGCCQLGVSSTV